MGREAERQGGKHQCVAASHVSPTRDPATTQACAPTGNHAATQACAPTGNQTGDPPVPRLVLSPLSHTSQGVKCIFRNIY